LLNVQVQIYSVDTGNFYSNEEMRLHLKNHKARSERKQLVDGYTRSATSTKSKRVIIGAKELEDRLIDAGISRNQFHLILKDAFDFSEYDQSVIDIAEQYKKTKQLIEIKNRTIKKSKNELLTLLSNKVEMNNRSNGKHHIRELRENQVSNKNVISVFESFFTRTIQAKPDELCEDFMVVQVYYFDIIKDLIYNGFMYKGEKYVYFTSSAGQIRTKKTVFVKESVLKKYEKAIMCGLSIDEINKNGGSNPNKYLAYMALSNSATDVWEEFDISKTIVIDDFETNVFGTYDLVDETDYSIKRISDYVPITHTDGAGMVLPNAFGVKQCNKMVRLPWVKGLLGVFDFKRFIEIHNCSSEIIDIYGVKHDVIAEDIQVIFCKSQFKMAKYYKSWADYQEKYNLYKCTAGFTNPEEERIKDATINYQMLQTLTDITDDEISRIAGESVNRLNNISSSVENIKRSFGISPYNTNKTAFQQAVELYPNLLNDEYVKSILREIKDSMVKRCKAGKLYVNGKYTFLMPDLYAACQHWFQGIENPEGLLSDGEVFCWLFRKHDKVDCLRSPHLFIEHAIRKNTASNKSEKQKMLREWFTTSAIYTSCHDMISKILQFDVDGDKSLVVTNKTLIEVAERNIAKYDIVPLYYNMRKAEPVQLSNKSIYNGLNAAFIGGNIGIYSNNISKIWNSDIFLHGTEEERKEAVDIVKLLCCENNFVIDYAKTLYKPIRPKDIHEKIIKYTNLSLPSFFKYAKDKKDWQVSALNNSFVNKLENVVPSPRINCRKLGLDAIDYRLMMSNPDIEFRFSMTDKGKIIKEETDPLILKYNEMNQKYGFIVKQDHERIENTYHGDVLKDYQLKQDLVYKRVIDESKECFSSYGYTDQEITDILVKYLYGIRNNKHKTILWACYGDVILDNLKKHFKSQTRDVQCVDCGEWISVNVKATKAIRCEECYSEYRKKYKAEKEKEARSKKRGQYRQSE